MEDIGCNIGTPDDIGCNEVDIAHGGLEMGTVGVKLVTSEDLIRTLPGAVGELGMGLLRLSDVHVVGQIGANADVCALCT